MLQGGRVSVESGRCPSSVVPQISKLVARITMASDIAYTRKRRRASAIAAGSLVSSSSAQPSAANPKHEFDEFRHAGGVRRQLRRAESKEEAGALGADEERLVVGNEIWSGGGDGGGAAEAERAIRVRYAAGESRSARLQEGCEALLEVVDVMVEALAPLTFKAPVAFVYNSLEYARNPHEEYVRKYGGKKVDVLLVGMNPGPFGMAQTGIPFGDSVLVREFLHITSEVNIPKEMHPKRPIFGLTCPRREVSGQRLWGWAQARFGTAGAFLDRFWVHNYCPLMFMEASGKNRTPDKLTATERASITHACNAALRAVIDVTKPRLVVGIGKYALGRCKECAPPGVEVGDILHPSPANPRANKDWAKLIEAQLRALGVEM